MQPVLSRPRGYLQERANLRSTTRRKHKRKKQADIVLPPKQVKPGRHLSYASWSKPYVQGRRLHTGTKRVSHLAGWFFRFFCGQVNSLTFSNVSVVAAFVVLGLRHTLEETCTTQTRSRRIRVFSLPQCGFYTQKVPRTLNTSKYRGHRSDAHLKAPWAETETCKCHSKQRPRPAFEESVKIRARGMVSAVRRRSI